MSFLKTTCKIIGIAVIILLTLNMMAGENASGKNGDHENMELKSRTLFGEGWEVVVKNEYAFVGAGCSLLVYDVSDKTSPEIVSYLDMDGAPSGLHLEGNLLYAAISPGGLRIIDISDNEELHVIGPIELGGGFMPDVFVSGDYAYVTNDDDGLYIIDISDDQNPVNVSHYPTADYSASVHVVGDYAFIVEWNDGMRVVDVSDKANPYEISHCDTNGWGFEIVIVDDYAYIADGEAGMCIIDVSLPNLPQQVGSCDTDGDTRSIYVQDEYAYLADRYGGVSIVDISDVENPEIVATLPVDGEPWGVYYFQNYVFTANRECGHGLYIIDASNKEDPSLMSYHDTGNQATGIQIVGDHAYIADTKAGLRILNIENPSEPIEVGSCEENPYSYQVYVLDEFAYVADMASGLFIYDVTVVENPILVGSVSTGDHPFDVHVVGDYAYLIEQNNGLRIIDVNDKSNPQEVGMFDTDGIAYSVYVVDDYAYAAWGEDELIIIDVSIKYLPHEVSRFTTEHQARDVQVVGDYAYVADCWQGIRIINVSDKEDPRYVASYDTNDFAMAVFPSGNLVYVGDYYNGLRIIDFSDLDNPKEIGFFDTYHRAADVYVSGDNVYVADDGDGVYILEYELFGGGDIPTVTITSHQNGSILSNVVTIRGNSDADGGTIEKVEVSIDGEGWNKADGTTSWSYDWDTTTVTDGEHILRFRAYDGVEYSNIIELNVNVQNENSIPEITIDYPEDGAEVIGTITISGSASDKNGNETIEKVEISIDERSWEIVEGTTSWSYEWDTTEVSNGEHTLRFRAYDGENHSDDVDLTLNIQNENSIPEVFIDYPGSGTEVEGSITLSGTTSDEDGDETIETVELSIDGEEWEAATGTTTWSYEWDTTLFEDGSYSVEVRAFDGKDYSDVQELTLTVKNVLENIMPKVSIFAPLLNSEVSNDVYCTGQASDEDGEIEKVEMSIDGGSWFQLQGKDVWSYTWDSKSVENGVHIVSVRSYDGGDYSDEVSITVTVNNKEDKEEDKWYEEPVYIGGLTSVIIVVVIVVALLFIRKRNTEYYDDWGDEEDYEEEY